MNWNNKFIRVNHHPLECKKVVCLTLDLEQDYGDLLEIPAYSGLQYVPTLISFFKKSDIPLTVFVQGSLFEMFPGIIEQFSSLDVEFELHSYSHRKYQSSNVRNEVETGKRAYNKYFSKDPKGYRFPSGIINYSDYEILADNGFKFDSSVFPSWRPGAFNNLNMPVNPYYVNDYKMIELPFTVFSRFLRVPVSLSYIKLLGLPYLELIKSPLLPNFVITNVHIHDLFMLPTASRINNHEFPSLNKYIYNKIYQQNNIDGLLLLKQLMTIFKKRHYTFLKLENIYDLNNANINK
jgi:peptidoglycan/xylan/chitin deacetylase (PgdA/CDA1 family)